MKKYTAEQIIKKLGLIPLDFEGGFFRQTYKCPSHGIPARQYGIESNTLRAASTAIYYLVTPENFSAIHRVKSDEIFHFYVGDSVEMIQISEDGKLDHFKLGSNIFENEAPQVLVPKNQWQALRLIKGGSWALMGTTVSPGYEQEDFELGRRNQLLKLYPDHFQSILEYTREKASV